MKRFRPTPALAIALVALFVALGGSAFAATHYVITRTTQIKPSVVRALRGKTGPAGRAGPAGPVALVGATEVDGPLVAIAPGAGQSSVATCPAGSRLLSGGGKVVTPNADGLATSQASADRTSWIAVAGNTGTAAGTVQAVAYCVPSGRAIAAAAPPAGAATREAAALAGQLQQATHTR
jgi:hypothetical protein